MLLLLNGNEKFHNYLVNKMYFHIHMSTKIAIIFSNNNDIIFNNCYAIMIYYRTVPPTTTILIKINQTENRSSILFLLFKLCFNDMKMLMRNL